MPGPSRGEAARGAGEEEDYGAEISAALLGAPLLSRLEFHDVIDSTNARALELARSGAPEGTLVVADHQTAGRGRRGRSWFAAPGSSLLFSLVLKPEVPPRGAGLLGIAAAAAAARATAAAGARVGVKWPNDVVTLPEERKLAGVLVEVSVRGGRLEHAVVGIGLNALGDPSTFPPEIRETATTLEAASRARPKRARLLREILEELAALYAALKESPAALLEMVRPAVVTLGKRVRVSREEGSLAGTAVGLGSWGELLVVAEGRLVEVSAGEVVHVRGA